MASVLDLGAGWQNTIATCLQRRLEYLGSGRPGWMLGLLLRLERSTRHL
jgi:hypothetical protein